MLGEIKELTVEAAKNSAWNAIWTFPSIIGSALVIAWGAESAEFLVSQGLEIYPQAIVSGFFGQMTQSAVIRFQEKYAAEILSPLGYQKGTGFVGPSTLAKINQLLK